LSLTAACAPDDEAAPGDLTTTFDTINGVVHVTNTGTAPPARLVPVVTIGPKTLTDTGSPDEFGGVSSVALGPDALTPLGGYPGNDDEGRVMQRQLDRDVMMEDWVAAFRFLRDHETTTGRVGAVGFCYGGGVVNQLAVRLPGLGAGVPFYGSAPAPEDVPSIQAPLMIQLAGLDERINARYPAYQEALEANGKDFVVHMYEGVNHGFHNDTTPRYDQEAASLAQERTIAFFNQHLRG